MQSWAVILCACVAWIGWGGGWGQPAELRAGEGAPVAAEAQPAVVCNVKVVSDKVDDVSSLDAWQAAVIKPGMKDKDKVLAAFDAVLKYHHHDVTPIDSLGMGWTGCTDAVKLFNVYGYCTGSGAQVAFIQLLRQMGLNTRAWSVYRWGVVEVEYDGGWHYLDPGMLCYFLNAKGEIASVDEIVKGLKDWYEANPGYLNEDKKVRDFMTTPGVAKGPAILTNCPTFDAHNSYPLNFFGWYTTMMVFNGTNKTPFLYEEPHTQGHRINLTLHRGEKITRYWNADHLPADWFKENTPDCLKAKPGAGVLYYTPKYGDLGNGRVGSGEVVYSVRLGGALPAAVLSADNISSQWPGQQDETVLALAPKDPAKPAVVVFDRANGYLYASGKVECSTLIGAGGSIAVAVSWDNGASWKDAGQFKSGPSQVVDISALIARKYQYRLKLTLQGTGTALTELKITEQFQCSQRALPALDAGANTIHLSAGPEEGTITVESTNPKFKDKQATWDDFHVVFAGADSAKASADNVVVAQGKSTTITVPISTPGDLVRVRMGCQYRAGDKNEGWDYQVSFDDGKTWKAAGRAAGPVRCSTAYVSFTEIPKGTRKALVRFAGDSKGNVVLFGFRVDADYAMPHAGFMPVQVTYAWQEGGAAKSQSYTAKTAAEKFTLSCGAKPTLESIALAIAP